MWDFRQIFLDPVSPVTFEGDFVSYLGEMNMPLL
jgi:hypothetical protein